MSPATRALFLVPFELIISLMAGPFDHPVTTTLKVHNPNSKPIQVKIKTTSPKAYSVRPNFSRVDPGDTIEVQGEPQQRQQEFERYWCTEADFAMLV